MTLLSRFHDHVRTLLRQRVKRRIPTAGLKPEPGDWLALENVKMQITHEISDDFWNWLVKVGWRQINLARDRRRYNTALKSSLMRLQNAHSRERMAVLRDIMQFRRPKLGAQTRI